MTIAPIALQNSCAIKMMFFVRNTLHPVSVNSAELTTWLISFFSICYLEVHSLILVVICFLHYGFFVTIFLSDNSQKPDLCLICIYDVHSLLKHTKTFSEILISMDLITVTLDHFR